jgi:hypothetical protein
MELGPVVKIVKTNRVVRSLVIIGKVRRAKDGTSGLIIVIVACDRVVQFVNGGFVEFGAGLLTNPSFELRVGGSLLRNEGNDRIPLQIEAIDDHLVKPMAYGWIAVRELSAPIEGNLEPETG